MWLVILTFAATIVTAIWYTQAENDKYLLKFLSLILWGTSIMVLVDHTLPFLMEGGGEFFEMTTEAMVLGSIMLIAALAVWEGTLLLKDPKGVIFKRKSS